MATKLQHETVVQAVQEIKKASGAKKRKFLETVELQVALKNYDPNKDKRFGGAIKLPSIPRPKYKVCLIGDDKHCHEAKEAKVPFLTQDDLKKMNKNKKAVKKLAQQYHSFLASASLDLRSPVLSTVFLDWCQTHRTSLSPLKHANNMNHCYLLLLLHP
jgi:large subunit ribosomal protein L10Ae